MKPWMWIAVGVLVVAVAGAAIAILNSGDDGSTAVVTMNECESIHYDIWTYRSFLRNGMYENEHATATKPEAEIELAKAREEWKAQGCTSDSLDSNPLPPNPN